MASLDAFIVVAPVNNTYINGSKQYDMVFTTQANTQAFVFGYSNVYLCISSNGYVGIGLSNPTSSLQVAGDITPKGNSLYNLGTINNNFSNLYIGNNITLSNSSTIASFSNGVNHMIPGTTSNDMFSFYAGSNQIVNFLGNLDIYCNGSVYSYGDFLSFSDSNYKTNLKIIPNALDKVKSLSGYTFNIIDPKTNFIKSKRQIGLLAQEVQKIIPEAVTFDNNFYNISYGNLVGLIIEAIKELDNKINNLI